MCVSQCELALAADDGQLHVRAHKALAEHLGVPFARARGPERVCYRVSLIFAILFTFFSNFLVFASIFGCSKSNYCRLC